MMKTINLVNVCVLVAMCTFVFSGCKKDSTTNNSITSQQTAQVQNSDVQDAVADRNDQDVDNTLDALQSNNYQQTTAVKNQLVGITVIVDHPDSTTFPKTIQIIYNAYQDSTSGEVFTKNGEIDIVVTPIGDNYQMVTRAYKFINFSIKTDSTIVSVNGTRTVAKLGGTFKLNGIKSLRLSTTDGITANLKYAIVTTGSTDSLKFTRLVERQRTAVLNLVNVGGLTWKTARFKNIAAFDTITLSGTVTGTNEAGDSYTKTVSNTTPLEFTFYKGTPVISSGTMELTTAGSLISSYTLKFKEDLPNHPFKTLVSVTNNTTLKTHSFDRQFGSKIAKWW